MTLFLSGRLSKVADFLALFFKGALLDGGCLKVCLILGYLFLVGLLSKELNAKEPTWVGGKPESFLFGFRFLRFLHTPIPRISG